MITIYKFDAVHINKTFDWVQEPELRELFTIKTRPTWTKHKAHCNQLISESSQEAYAIYDSGSHTGNMGIKNISGNSAEIWLYIGEAANRGNGVGTRACELLLIECMRLGLRCIYLHVLQYNVRAIKMYEKLGFKKINLSIADEKYWHSRGLQIIKMQKVLY